MSKSKTPVSESVTGVSIELSQTKVWTAKKTENIKQVFCRKNLIDCRHKTIFKPSALMFSLSVSRCSSPSCFRGIIKRVNTKNLGTSPFAKMAARAKKFEWTKLYTFKSRDHLCRDIGSVASSLRKRLLF